MTTRGIALALAMLLPTAARAEMFDDGYKPCGSRANTIAIVGCIDAKTKAWDQRLNAAYGALQKVIDEGQREKLRMAERTWLQYRDANCGFYAAAEGSIRQINAAECLRAMTAARTSELEQAARP